MSLEALALHEISPHNARTFLRELLRKDSEAASAVYSAFSRWTWRALVERRLDEDLREWHRLLLDVAATLASRSGGDDKHSAGAPASAPPILTERLRALADLVRESIATAQVAVPAEMLQRAHVAAILQALASRSPAFVDRKSIAEGAELKDANLSRILSLLAMNGLLEREARGRAAAFRITRKGLNAIGLLSDGTEAGQSRPAIIKTGTAVVIQAGERAPTEVSVRSVRFVNRQERMAALPRAHHFRIKQNETDTAAPPQFSYQEVNLGTPADA